MCSWANDQACLVADSDDSVRSMVCRLENDRSMEINPGLRAGGSVLPTFPQSRKELYVVEF